jgi:hypothetical protein
VRVTRVLSLTLATVAATVALAPAAMAAPEPCVTVYDPFNPGYAAPTCPVAVVRDLLP